MRSAFPILTLQPKTFGKEMPSYVHYKVAILKMVDRDTWKSVIKVL